jgi:biotin transport system substrate-specific component
VFVSYVAGSAVIYLLGVTWLSRSTGLSLSAAITVGMTPFLVGDLLKAALAAGALPLAWRGVRRLEGDPES